MKGIKTKKTAGLGECAKKIFGILEKEYPNARCTLDYRSPFELLVATILSAQCTDARVNQITPSLFKKYPRPEDYLHRPVSELEKDIRPTGFFRNKARSIVGSSRILVEKHRGEVPDTMDALLELPGVSRKTANVVLGNAFGIASGVVVDTHVRRLADRLRLSEQKDPAKIEKDLMEILPQKNWILFSHLMQAHGRKICIARKPRCPQCVINKLCPSAQI